MFGGPSDTQAQSQTVASGVSIQSSVWGSVVPVIYGTTRITGNLVDYGNFQSIAIQSSDSSGGKGGDGGHGSTTYDYKTDFIFALGEGPLGGVGTVWATKKKQTFSSSSLSFFDGHIGQTAWGHLSIGTDGVALGYSGTGYVCAAAYDLGSSAQLPNLSYEVTGLLATVNSGKDADPAAVINDILTNAQFGVGFPAGRILNDGAHTSRPFGRFSDYCLGAGLWISPAFDTQADAASQLQTIVQSCNSEFVWTGAQLTIVPYGDENVGDYVAPNAPLFDLTDDDFLYQDGQDPVQMTRARPSDQMNSVRFEFLDRNANYNANIVEQKNQAAIEAYGLRGEQPEQMHHFCDASAAKLAATLKLQRQSVRNVYSFTLGWKYCVLDPMDIVTLTDAALGLDRQWVRIRSLQEDDNGNIAVTAEEYLGGTGHAPLYDFEPGSPYDVDYNVDPGNVTASVIFEPPPLMLAAEQINTPHIMIGACGGPDWGGAEVWVSVDNATYKKLGELHSPCRIGTLTATLPTSGNVAPTADTTHTLAVDLSLSDGVLGGTPTQDDADKYRDLCWVGGELISYWHKTLTGPNAYSLTYLQRGVYGSTVAAHSAGTKFARIDETVRAFRLQFAPIDYAGVPLYIKLVSINKFGLAKQDIAFISPITYTPSGLGKVVLDPGSVTITTDVSETADGNWTTELQIAWGASPDPWFDEYQVQYQARVLAPGDWRTKKVDRGTLKHTIKGLPSGVAYDVRVRAVRSYGGPFYSNWVTATNYTIPQKTTLPAAPTSPVISTVWRQNIIGWTASTDNDVRFYNIWRNTTSTLGTATLIATHSGTSYRDDQLPPGQAYFYWVQAVDRSGNQSVVAGPVSSTTPLTYDKTNLVHDPQFQEASTFWTLQNAGSSPVIVAYQNAATTGLPGSANGSNNIGALTAVQVNVANIPAGSGLNYGARSNFIEVSQGQWYRASCHAIASGAGVNKNAQLFIQWYDINLAFISNTTADGPQTSGQYAATDIGERGSVLDSGNGDVLVAVGQAPVGAYFAKVFPCVPGGGGAAPAGTGAGWWFSKVKLERQVENTRIQDGAVTKAYSGQTSAVSLPALPSTTTIFSFTCDVGGDLTFNCQGTETLTGSATTEYILQVNGSLVLTWQWGNLHLNAHTPVNKGDVVTVIGYYQGTGSATLKGAGYNALICQK